MRPYYRRRFIWRPSASAYRDKINSTAVPKRCLSLCAQRNRARGMDETHAENVGRTLSTGQMTDTRTTTTTTTTTTVVDNSRRRQQQRPTTSERQDDVSSLDRTPQRSVPDGWPFSKAKEWIDAQKAVKIHLDPHAEEYNMNHKRRGVALVLNHVRFESMSTRKGSIKDSVDLKASLDKLGFDVRIYTDRSAKTISTILHTAAAEDHTDADCLIVVAMSHGESGMLHSTDSLYPVDMLWAPFTGDRCSSLAGKPKLFFIQACRGAQLDKGVKIIHETDSKRTTYSIPAYADIMVAYSTYDGFYSWRNPDSGSWFIQALCEELNCHGNSRDLLTLMTFVNRRVAIEYQSYVPENEKFHARKQIPSVVSMLTRLVYFPDKHEPTANATNEDTPKKEDTVKSERK